MPKGEAVNSLWKYFGLSSTAIPTPKGGVEERLEMLTSQIEAMRSERKIPIDIHDRVSATNRVELLLRSMNDLLGDRLDQYQVYEGDEVITVRLREKPSAKTRHNIFNLCKTFGFNVSNVSIGWKGQNRLKRMLDG